MWNPPESGDYEDATPPEDAPATLAAETGADDPYAEINWNHDQLQRMESEWRRLQRAFAYHPHVTLSPLSGDPPSHYQVDYRLTTLVVNPQTSQLEYVTHATLHVVLPPGFPEDAPVVRPVTPVFHPNISFDGLYIEGLWHPNETLLSLIRKVGDILAYRSYDPDYAINPAAMQWLAANQQILPLDGQADLGPTAGGEPLDRICRYGPQSLESMKQSLIATQSALVSAASPTTAALRDYAHKTRLALNLFLENDVPDNLQAQASELETAARDLIDLQPMWDFARERRQRVIAVRQVVKQLLGSKGPLAAEIDKFVGLVSAGDPEEPMIALKLIPESARLQPLQFSLPKLLGEAEQRIATIEAGVTKLTAMHAPALIPPDSLLGKRLERELATGDADVQAVRGEADQALALLRPVVCRGAAEALALDFTSRWREYLDMATKARAMERQIREIGSEGLQAYYIQNEGGRYGPFQFEQTVDLGSGELIARAHGGKSFDVFDPSREAVIGESKSGTLTIALPAAPGAADEGDGHESATFATTFTITDRCDDLMVLLEFLRRSTIETVQKFAAYDGVAESWAGKVCRVLARPEVKKGLEEELARAARRWRHTIHDLHALGPWKERLATYLLVHRASGKIPELVETIRDRKRKHAESLKVSAQIMTRCGRDLETGNLIVPPKLSRPYHDEQKVQEECSATVKAASGALKSLVQQLSARLQSSKRLGDAAALAFRAIPPLPEALGSVPLMDAMIGNLVASIEELIQVSLGGPPPGPIDSGPPPSPDGAADTEQGEYGIDSEGQAYGADGVSSAADTDHGAAALESAEETTEGQYASEEPTEGYATEEDALVSNEYTDDDAEVTDGHLEHTDVVFGFEPETHPGS